MATLHTHPTPNPNSLKITPSTGAFIDGGLESFNSAQEADGHPLGQPLFQIPGVVNVLILPAFLTITKHPDHGWDAIWPHAKRILLAHLNGG